MSLHSVYKRRLGLYERRLKIMRHSARALLTASQRLEKSLSDACVFENDAQLKAALALFNKLPVILKLLPADLPPQPPPPPPKTIQLPQRPPCPLCNHTAHHWVTECPHNAGRPDKEMTQLMSSQSQWYRDLMHELGMKVPDEK